MNAYAIKDDFELLRTMLKDASQQPLRYNPGPYWISKANNTANEIKRCGLQDFRGSSNLIGLSYSDNQFIDIRDSYNHGLKKLARWVTRLSPINRIFNAQLQWTQNYVNASIGYAQEMLSLKPRTKTLLDKYTIPYSLLGGCKNKIKIKDAEYAIHYLNLLEQHDNLASRINFAKAKTVFEIGGGFGINIHLLLENYPNIRKVIYLDIPPNLYVGTQYLKAFYHDAVHDYRELSARSSLSFTQDDQLEIFCIAPWQIENMVGKVDIFMNANSFVEMPKTVVANYADQFMKWSEANSAAIALTTYDLFDLGTTFSPDALPLFFHGRDFESFTAETLLNCSRKNLYFVSAGKFKRTLNVYTADTVKNFC